MNKRKLNLKKYGISGKRYKELCGFCEQYPEWKKELDDFPVISGINYSDMPKSPNKGQSDSTYEVVTRLDNLLDKINLVESTAKLADAEFWEYIIKSVCYEVPIQYMQTREGMAISERAFYDRRRYFFYLLDKQKI